MILDSLSKGPLSRFLGGALPVLLTSLAFVLLLPLPRAPDEDRYLPIARAIAGGHGWLGEDGAPQVYRPPLFSLLLGTWLALTGGEHVWSVPVFQSLMLAVSAGCAGVLAGRLGATPPWQLVASWMFGLNPFVFTTVGFVSQEITLATLMAFAAIASTDLLGSRSRRQAAFAGALWGFSILGKVTAVFAPLVTGLFLLRIAAVPRRSLLRSTLVMLLTCSCVVGAWTLRNAMVFHRFILVNEQGLGVLEWFVAGGNPEHPASARWNAGGAAFIAESKAELSKDPSLTNADRKARLARKLLQYLGRHPGYVAGSMLQNAVRFTGLERAWFRDRGIWPGERYGMLYGVLYLAFQVPLFLGAFAAGLLARSRDDRSLLVPFLLCVVAVHWAVHIVVWGQPRYALPIYPILAALACVVPSLAAARLTERLVGALVKETP